MPEPHADISVLVADRDARVRAALRQLLVTEPGLWAAGEAADAASAMGQLADLLPDTLLVDPLLPTAAEGMTLLCAAVGAGIHVVVLTADRVLRSRAPPRHHRRPGQGRPP